jgi:hypothetical protein
VALEKKSEPAAAKEKEDATAAPAPAAQVVSLDAFRKK